ncbi:MAG: methylcobamide--CoM methyltransferase [Clostridia bacterium]|nr:methylcobamide--CoM methyltransferase [Clostridia bacterium]
MRKELTKQDVIAAIERKGGSKIPVVFHKWWGNGLEDKYGKELYDVANKYPDDIFAVFYIEPGEAESSLANPSYRWGYKDYTNTQTHSIGNMHELLPEWDELDDLLADFPNPNEPGNFDNVYAQLKNCPEDKYKLGCFWRLFHERFWCIRGMENLMMDYYDNMDGLRVLGERLLEYYKVIVDRFAEAGFDGIFTSDDLGHQSGPMMSPAVFEELYLPLYKEFIGYVHSKGMHVFLHSCGDNTKLMPYLIEAGLDVFHPIQAGCMDTAETVKNFGDKISFLAGVDVQHLLPDEDVNGVVKGVENMIDILYKPEGGLLLACGNGIMPDTPLENIDAMLNTVSTYNPGENK